MCSNGGYYAKTTHTCYPPSDPDTTTTTTLQPATSTPAPTESTCVSNKGRPYDRDNCLWFAKAYGCDWVDNRCSCTNHGVFSKTSKKCWPAPGSPTPPPCGDCHKPGRRACFCRCMWLPIVVEYTGNITDIHMYIFFTFIVSQGLQKALLNPDLRAEPPCEARKHTSRLNEMYCNNMR